MSSRPTTVKRYNTLAPFNAQILKPVIRAYGWALLSVTAPRIISLLISAIKRKRDVAEAFQKIYETVKRQLELERLPASFAILVTGAVVIPRAIVYALDWHPSKTKTRSFHWDPTRWHFLRFTSTFIAGLLSFYLLNRKDARDQRLICAKPAEGSSVASSSSVALAGLSAADGPNKDQCVDAERAISLAGRTIDLTFFGMVRATDIALRSLWSYFIPHRKTNPRRLNAARTVDWLAGPMTFVASSYIIMWAWFYSPYNLPKAYQTWISSAAQLDSRLLQALRECRQGLFVYGKDTGRGDILRPMCRDLGLPEDEGDPALVDQIPCRVVHCGNGDSCEYNALQRLAQAWLFAMKMYLPLNILIFTRRKPSSATVLRALKEASRSASFLGAFVSLFYYGVCLARRRIGPKLFPGITPQVMDSGVSVSVGCLLCGTSVFLEKRSRRQEIAFFVAPRALATAFPRRYERVYLWREQVVYATCAAAILTAAVECPRQVRGVFGKLLQQVLA